MEKYQKLSAFLNKYAHLPEQGTDAWKAIRTNFIGGSEVATILKKNKNKSISKLITERLGFNPFKGNVITHWGNIFEELIRLHCQEVFSCSIMETSSIPYEHGYLSYSPDGLSVVPTNAIIRQFGELTESADKNSAAQLTLFEFKCPHSRVATHEIPEHYLPQVSIGMNIIDIMETAIFVQATYRRCTIDQIGYNTFYNNYGHFKSADTSEPPVECGFITVMAKTIEDAEEVNNYFDSMGIQYVLCQGEAILDIGNLNDMNIFEAITEGIVGKKYTADYTFRHTYDQTVFKNDHNGGHYSSGFIEKSLIETASMKIADVATNPLTIGIIPYKLLCVHMTQVSKNPEYIQETNAHEQAKKIISCIDDHKHLTDKKEIMKSIRSKKL